MCSMRLAAMLTWVQTSRKSMFSLAVHTKRSARNLSVDSAQGAPQFCLGRQPVCLTSAQACAWWQSSCIAVAAALCLYRNGSGVICCGSLYSMRLVAVCSQLLQLLLCSCLQQCMYLSRCVQYICLPRTFTRFQGCFQNFTWGARVRASYHTRVGLSTYVLAEYVVALTEPGTGTHRQLFWCSACCIT